VSREDPAYLRFFPYDEPYDHQREAMGEIHRAFADGNDVLLEGACGTGKTLAALVPALEHAREHDKTVVITTNVHQQMRQFVEDARAITRQEPIRSVVFRGKGSMCHIDVDYNECQTLRDATRDLVDAEGDRADLERQQRELLEQSQESAGSGEREAAQQRSAIMDELGAVEERVGDIREERATCDHYYNNLTTDTDDFFAWLFDDVRTPDDVYEYAESATLCGYELLKEGMEGVDLVVCNYHHLLDPMIREQFFRWLGRDPEDVLAVFDEAHNVENAARDHARRTLTETTLSQALDELDETDDVRANPAANVLGTFRTALQASYEGRVGVAAGGTEVGEHWEDVAIDNADRKDDLTLAFLQEYTGPGFHEDLDQALSLGADLDDRYAEAFSNGETATRQECQTLQAAEFLQEWLAESDAEGQYPVVSVRRRDVPQGQGDVYGRAELYTCIPSAVTSELFSELHATVLMSATLQPFDVTRDVLGLEGEITELAYGEQFPEERRRTFAVDGPALFASKRDDRATQDVVAGTLADAVRMTPGNTLAFFPSYAEAERYHELLGSLDVDATRFLDRPATQARDLREEFVDGDNAILCTSLWGTLAEGVSYDGDDARTVVVVGVPYPHLDERMEAVQAAYDTAFDDDDAGWRYAVEIPTVRKTRQAVGRVVRSPEDFGARILLDKRYTRDAELEMREYAVRGTFPAAERSEMVDIAPAKLKFAMLNFYTDMDAYDGAPPEP